jgi:hypothetical protein
MKNTVHSPASVNPSLEHVQVTPPRLEASIHLSAKGDVMNTTLNTSSNHLQIQSLTRIALLLSSLAAIPGFFGSLYLIAMIYPDSESNFTLSFWLTFGPLTFAMVAGWWLYYTYWLELNGKNRFGKVSWFVSALVNALLAAYPLKELLLAENLLPNSLLLLWLLVMIIISSWVWVLKLRERL